MQARICTHPWEFAVRPFRMVGELHYVGNTDVSSYLLDTGDGLILFDTTFPQTVSLGAANVRCVHTPGHTPGAMSYFFTVTEDGRDYTVGMHGGPGLNTLSDDYMQTYNVPPEWRTRYARSVTKLREHACDVFAGIHPGQGGTLERATRIGRGPNPFIDPEAWPMFMTGLETAFTGQFGPQQQT